MRTGIVVLGVVALLAGQAVSAEPPGGVLNAKTMRCKVDKGAHTVPEKWGEVSTVRWRKNNVLHFDAIDIKKGKARIIGGAGGADLLVLPGRGGLHFIEQTPSGNVVLRTVFAGAVGARRYRYVTSRHVHLGRSGPVPSQYYGTCVVLDWR